MFNIILYQPEIPPNTGNIIRLCANTGSQLHLIRPLGFELSEQAVRRSGLDYAELVDVKVWDSLADCLNNLRPPRWFAISTRGQTCYTAPRFNATDVFVFGSETQGLPARILETVPTEHCLRIPMLTGNRSLNLSNAVAVVIYEAWRQ